MSCRWDDRVRGGGRLIDAAGRKTRAAQCDFDEAILMTLLRRLRIDGQRLHTVLLQRSSLFVRMEPRIIFAVLHCCALLAMFCRLKGGALLTP